MDRIFWPLLGVGLGFLLVAVPGYVELAFAVTLILIVMTWFRVGEVVSSREEFTQKLSEYLSRIEDLVAHRDEPQKVEVETVVQQGVTKEEMTDSLDRVAAKMIDIENRMNQVKKTLAAAFSALDERIRAVEEEAFPKQEEENA